AVRGGGVQVAWGARQVGGRLEGGEVGRLDRPVVLLPVGAGRLLPGADGGPRLGLGRHQRPEGRAGVHAGRAGPHQPLGLVAPPPRRAARRRRPGVRPRAAPTGPRSAAPGGPRAGGRGTPPAAPVAGLPRRAGGAGLARRRPWLPGPAAPAPP